MKKIHRRRRRSGEPKVVKPKFQSTASRIVVLLQQRSDVTRKMLSGILNKSPGVIDSALVRLSKAGIRIFPSKGAGTPLKIADTLTSSEKYLNWRRSRFLPTSRRMIIAETEIGERYQELAAKPVELLQTLNDSTKQE